MALTGVRNCGWTQPKNAREVALLGEREEVAGPGKRLPHVVAGGREHGAERDHRGSSPRPGRAPPRRPAGFFDAASAGSVPSATICTSVITIVDDDDGHDEGERDGPLRIPGFAGGNGYDLVAAEGKDQQQPARRELGERRRALRYRAAASRRRTVPTTMKTRQRQQLADRQHVHARSCSGECRGC